MNLLHLVDSIEYVENNCFQHQLLRTLKEHSNVRTVSLDQLKFERSTYDGIICCLKQRTLNRNLQQIKDIIGRCPINVYDQDPWTAFEDGSPFKGTYQHAFNLLNIKSFSVTTKFWADHILQQGLPGKFVRMWMLPEYCNTGPSYETRTIQVGFTGTVHYYRKNFFDQLKQQNVPISIQSGNVLSYKDYLKNLSTMKVFAHCEDNVVTVDQKKVQLGARAVWIKDVEACAQGCFTIRNRGADSESYYEGLHTTMLYDDVSQVADMLNFVENMHPDDRRSKINETVNHIRLSNKWKETAATLTTFNS